jgi:hypothetical protein
VEELLGDGVHDIASYTATVTQRFASPEAYADFFLTHYGPTYAAASRLDDAGRAALREDLVRIAHQANRAATAPSSATGTTWSSPPRSADAEALRMRVPRGTHELSDRGLVEPVWSARVHASRLIPPDLLRELRPIPVEGPAVRSSMTRRASADARRGGAFRPDRRCADHGSKGPCPAS